MLITKGRKERKKVKQEERNNQQKKLQNNLHAGILIEIKKSNIFTVAFKESNVFPAMSEPSAGVLQSKCFQT